MKKFYSFIHGIIIFLLTIIIYSCDSIQYEEDIIIPFAIGDSLFFSLQDINAISSTYGNLIGPQNYNGKVVLIYFTSNET
ncbi:MAG: hypothetical protein CMF96_11235 [Candidatus Marinimicrobia bacterium]|nr:hypothetical protein [Candidatus Neomarinimicrobiota bacterium]|tara:strand:- start:4179 stop:4418 length:240 start_codon:yes stop_codon:yes gene_type:complete